MNDLVTQLNARIQQINALLRVADSQELLDLRSRLSRQLEQAQGKLFDQRAPVFAAATKALRNADRAAVKAAADIAKIQTAIDKFTAAAKAVDEVIGLAGRVA